MLIFIGKFLYTFSGYFVDMAFYMMIGLFFVGVLHVFLDDSWVKKHLGGNDGKSTIKSALFGVPLPLCSCSVVPTALYIDSNGASLSAMMAFLISTPQTGVDSFVATFGMMGLTFALYRPIVALISGVFGGRLVAFIVNKFNLSMKVVDSSDDNCGDVSCSCNVYTKEDNEVITKKKKSLKEYIVTLKEGLKYSYGEFFEDIAIHLLIGIFIATIIDKAIPDAYFLGLSQKAPIIAMIMVIVAGIPMYICSTSSIPIAISLMFKGISPGIAFAFLFAGPVTNIATINILRKKIGGKVTGVYIGVVTLFAIGFGFLFDFIIDIFNIKIIKDLNVSHIASESGNVTYKVVVAGIFIILVFRILVKKLIKNFKNISK